MADRLNRGDIVIGGERGAFTGKPRPWLVIQSDEFLDDPSTITVCMASSTEPAAVFRIPIAAGPANGLEQDSTILVDKVLTLRVAAIVRRAGALTPQDMARVDTAIRRWLDL